MASQRVWNTHTMTPRFAQLLESWHRMSRMKRWCLSLLALCLIALAVFYNLPSTQTAVELYHKNLTFRAPLATMPVPRPGDRILIFAPHEDDETIGCGGYIQRAVAVGAHVSLVMITNGDYPKKSLILQEKAITVDA